MRAYLYACTLARDETDGLTRHAILLLFRNRKTENNQVIKMRKTFDSNVRFMLMNSFSTSEDTLEFLKKYPELANDPNLELVQVIGLTSESRSPRSPFLVLSHLLYVRLAVPSSSRKLKSLSFQGV